jgi:hypothetical protein
MSEKRGKYSVAKVGDARQLFEQELEHRLEAEVVPNAQSRYVQVCPSRKT